MIITAAGKILKKVFAKDIWIRIYRYKVNITYESCNKYFEFLRCKNLT